MRALLLLGLTVPAILFFLASADGVPTAAQVQPPTAAAQPVAKPIRALLVIGGCCHDYKKQKDIITKGISARANVEWTISYDPDTGTKHVNPVYSKDDWANEFDIIVHDECTADVKDMTIVNRVLEPHRKGLPAVVLHCAMHSYRTDGWNKKDDKPTPWFELTGLATTGHGAQIPIDLTFVNKESPITKGLENWITIKEELYNNFTGKLQPTAMALTRGKQGKSDTIVVWTNIYNQKAKVFSTTLGHNNETVSDDRYMELLTRGLLWATDHLTEDGKPAPGYGRAK
jgi:type 1 glutamine amidotransferase